MEKRVPSRDAYGKKLIELGYKLPELVVLDADLSNSTRTSYFMREFPERHFNMGIAEANMALFAAGLAISGKVVFASSFAMFATGRAWEMVRNTIAHDNLNVKIVASHAGISVGEDGYSHQANEDLSIMRSIPNLEVLTPSDAIETEKMIEYAAFKKGPMYIRLSREAFPVFQDPNLEFTGKAQILKDGDAGTIISSGTMVYPALKAVEQLEKELKISLRFINMPSIKPIDEQAIIESAEKTPWILTCEEHSIIGGLGSAVSEVTASKKPCSVYRMGINDEFGQSGLPAELFKFYKLSTDDIVKRVKDLLS